MISPLQAATATRAVIGTETITIRPLRANDTALEADFVRSLSVEARRLRFFCSVREMSAAELTLLCDMDGEDSMAFVATIQKDGQESAIGVSRYARSAHDGDREMALTIADAWQHKGVAELLVSKLAFYAASHGVKLLYSVELADNHWMRELAHAVGMSAQRDPDDASQIIYSLRV